MKINKLIINSYGKLKNKEINLEKGINVIYGKNETGKSTLINFIINSFYGISKNKDGKEISDYDKYKPWTGEEFSGKVLYQLDNGKNYEIYRDFNKKNPKLFNENMEDISKEYNIDKNNGNEFFYEQTKIDEELFLSTLAINQNEVKLEKSKENFLIQKIANLAQTGDDNISFKRVLDRINRRQLDEVGTERSREKPINVISRNIQNLENEKQRLEKYKNFKYEFEEEENNLKQDILNLENESNFLTEIKLLNENEKIEKEKIKIKEDIKNENIEKINLLDNKIEELKINNKNKKTKNKLIKIFNIILIILILINIVQFIFIKNNFKYIFLLTIPMFLIFYIFFINKENKKIENNKKIINEEFNKLNNEKNILEDNLNNLEEELKKLKNNYNLKITLEKEKIKNKYSNKVEVYNFLDLSNINLEIEKLQKEINNKKFRLHTLDLDKKNIEPELDNLLKIEEELVNNNEKMSTILKLNQSLNLAKEVLIESYEKMKKSIIPKFTENLSKNISSITNGKYKKGIFNEEGLIVETENGDYVQANKLSVGTIDQLYISLRLSLVNELEKVPILLDEVFAFYDDDRLKNVLLYLNDSFKDRQIIIFTCTERERNILNNSIDYNYIEL